MAQKGGLIIMKEHKDRVQETRRDRRAREKREKQRLIEARKGHLVEDPATGDLVKRPPNPLRKRRRWLPFI